MDWKIRDIIKELKVIVAYSSLIDEPGHYIAALNTIIINNDLSEFDQLKTLLHELGHASQHQNNYVLYNRTLTLHSKMEAEAEEYMTKFLIKSYLGSENLTLEQINYVQFIEDSELDINKSHLIKEWFVDVIRLEKLA